MPTDAKAAAGLVQQAVAALRRVAATPEAGGDLAALADDLVGRWERRPFIAAVFGSDTGARLSFLNELIGSQLLDASRARSDTQTLRLTPAAKTSCAAHYRDGSLDEFVPGDPDPAVSEQAIARSEQVQAERDDLESRRAQLELRKMALPPVLRAPPPVWAVWLWLWRWILGLLHAREQAALAEAEAAVAQARKQLQGTATDARPPAPRDFARRIGDLTDAGSVGAQVDRVVLAVAGSRMHDGVAVDSMPHASIERSHDPDAWLWVGDHDGDPSPAPTHSRRAYVIGAVDPPSATAVEFRRAGDRRHASESLHRLLCTERALGIANRASRALREATARFDDALAAREATFDERLRSLESRRIPEPDRFTNAQLKRIHPEVVESVHQLIEVESEHARRRLDTLCAAWSAEINAAETSEQIREALADIEQRSTEQIRAAGEAIEARVRKGLSAAVAKLHDRALTELRPISPPAENAIPLVPGPPDLALSIIESPPDSLGPAPGRLARMFKSNRRLQAGICERIDERATRLVDLTLSDLLDLEPVVGRLLSDFVKASVAAAVKEHDRWLSGALLAEQRAIEQERAALAPVAQSRDVARADADRLDALATQTLASLPPTIRKQPAAS